MKKIILVIICFIFITNVSAKNYVCKGDGYEANISLEATSIEVGEKAKITINKLSDDSLDFIVRYKVNNGNELIELTKMDDKTYHILGKLAGEAKVSVEVDFMKDNNLKGNCKTEVPVTILSNETTLKSLNIDVYDMSNIFKSNQYEYEIEVPYEVESINISAVPTDAKSKITGEGKRFLNDGLNTYLIQVVSESGSKAVYKIAVRKGEASTDTTLKNLVVNGFLLTPTFKSNITNYKLSVGADTDSITINAEANDILSKIEGLGTFNLATGTNSFSIIVRAQNGDERQYKITVDKSLGASQLVSLKVSKYKFEEKFNRNTYLYHLDIYDDVKSLKIVAEASDSDKIEIIGNENLKYGKNEILIKVTGEGKTGSTYKIIVNKINSNNILEELSNKNAMLTSILLIIFITCIALTGGLIFIFIKRNYLNRKKLVKKIKNKDGRTKKTTKKVSKNKKVK